MAVRGSSFGGGRFGKELLWTTCSTDNEDVSFPRVKGGPLLPGPMIARQDPDGLYPVIPVPIVHPTTSHDRATRDPMSHPDHHRDYQGARAGARRQILSELCELPINLAE